MRPQCKKLVVVASVCVSLGFISPVAAVESWDAPLPGPEMTDFSGADAAQAADAGGDLDKVLQGEFSKCGDTACRPDCRPRWGVRAGALALFRERPDSATLFVNPLDTTQNLDANDFDFGYKTGYDLSLMRRLDRWPDVEFRYMGCDAWTARAGTVTDPAVPLAIAAQIPVFVPTGRDISAVYSSDLDSFELNLRTHRWCGCVTLLVGFRYLELDESFHADLVDAVTPAPTVVFDTDTQNRLYGGQIGAEVMVVEWKRFSLDFVGKAGVYQNSAAQSSLLDTSVVTVPATGGLDRTSFVGEAHLAAVFCISRNLTLRASYGVMGISNLALATDQMAQTDFFTGTGAIANGNAFYHGAFLGLDFGY